MSSGVGVPPAQHSKKLQKSSKKSLAPYFLFRINDSPLGFVNNSVGRAPGRAPRPARSSPS